MKKQSIQLLSICLVLMLLAFTGGACKPWKPPTPCTTTTTSTPATTTTPVTTTTPETTTIPTTTTTMTAAEEATAEWSKSGHADNSSEAFRDWDDPSDPSATVSSNCASCHSTAGFYEFLLTENRSIANPPLAVNNVGITCDACHSDRAYNKTSVLFYESGQRVDYPGESSVLCGQCHQGRAWKGDVEDKILAAYPGGDNESTVDKQTASLTSTNPHYVASFAAIKASKSLIAVDYDLPIAADLSHPGGTDCMVCHDQHSTEFRLDARCNTCHPSFESLEDVRAWGNADVLDAKKAQLYSVIRQYAADNTTEDADNNTKEKACIVQSGSSGWYLDNNCNGVRDTGDNTYNKFTPRLLRACYNYLVYVKDPGIFAHNSSYAAAFLDASINDIRSYKAYPITDAQEATAEWELSGHADYNSLAFRDWDNASNPDATVQANCASCHSTVGFNEFCRTGNRTIAQPPLAVNNIGITCYACHSADAGCTGFSEVRSLRPDGCQSGCCFCYLRPVPSGPRMAGKRRYAD